VGDYTARLAESWQQQGHEVTVFAASPEKSGGQKSVVGSPEEGIQVVRIRLDAKRDVRVAAEAIAAAKPEQVQIEYSNYGWSRWGFAFHVDALVRALRKRGLLVTVALHEFPLEFLQHPLHAGISVVQRLHFARLVLGASEVLTNTQERVRILRRWFPWRRERIHFRPNSSHIPVAASSAERRAALRAERAPGAQVVLATFGMFHPGKRYEAVIEAAGMARSELRPAVWLLGDERQAQTAYLEKLRQQVRTSQLEGSVWWSGHLAPGELSAYLQAVDIFVLPQPDGHLTRSSAFMAAAAHGLAVIAVRNVENQKDFAHGENVWLVDGSRAELFAQAFRQLASDAALRARLGSNLRALYEKRFSWVVAAPPRGSVVGEAEKTSGRTAEAPRKRMTG
jgi:glycosyltransferase involved in cell wall biosynthesis